MHCLLSCRWSASTCAHVPKVRSLYQLCCPTKTHNFATNLGLVHVIPVCCHWIAGGSEFGTNTRRIGFTLTTQIAAPTLTRWIALQARRHHRHRTWKTDVDPKHGSLNVPIEHHPTIRYMVYNGYYKVMSNSPKNGHLPIPAKIDGKPQILGVLSIQSWNLAILAAFDPYLLPQWSSNCSNCQK